MIETAYLYHSGSDLDIVNAARVSFSKRHAQFDATADTKLIHYLAKHNHWTPFSHTSITFRVKAPIAIRTQCFKHKIGFTENEISRRYVSDSPEYFTPQWREKSEKTKQGSGNLIPAPTDTEITEIYRNSVNACLKAYNTLIEKGVCPEQARFVLPQGTLTQWIWTASLSAYARFYTLRTDSKAQKEIQQLAQKIGTHLQQIFPVSWNALIHNA